MEGIRFLCRQLIIRQIKNAIRTAQAVVAFNGELLSYEVLIDILDTVGDFGDFEGACECQQRKMGYFSGGERASYLKALYGTLPLEQDISSH
jgi:hypothetical protein